MERSHASREMTLTLVRRSLEIFWAQERKGLTVKEICAANKSDNLCVNVEKEMSTLRSMGFMPEAGINTSHPVINSPNKHRAASFERERNFDQIVESVKGALCYNASTTQHKRTRALDPTFCHRSLKLLRDIHEGVEPPLLVMFTWWPDPMTDLDKVNRKLMYENLNMLRPIVEPVLFTDSRMNMASANSVNWTCLPVPEANHEGVPVFRSMSAVVMGKFNATFYGYARATTVFDASFIETLLAIKELYVTPSTTASKQGKTRALNTAGKPVFIYGKAMHYYRLGWFRNLQLLSRDAIANGNHTWADPKNALVYFVGTKQDMSDVPPLIVDDKHLTPFLVHRSRVRGHVTVEASLTVLAVYTFRNMSTTEWGREFICTRPRDPDYNRALVVRYMSGFNSTESAKLTEEFYSKYGDTGRVVIEK
ncbi:unnamed protein product [Lymnaea stagnalis]|uniref:Uncharacterized protein n=1 Tax=Lymnaea stagnalis TaxID=6523 RepID=A0AAV2HT86_LYMST